ncbi:MAG: nucleotide sugar dehydrogenase [Betaproteobacteria bacterium]|nr:nucleotide sugar dehydrogenase [Betaproteobacteria bacterium]
MTLENNTIVGVVGLGYVGLPLAVGFGTKLRTLGFDLSPEKIAHYRKFHDPTGEVSDAELRAATRLSVSTDPASLAEADIVVVAVPTPVDDARLPDFGPLFSACECVGPHLKKGAIVVFESTVYPGATEDVCIPRLEKVSGKRWKEDFFVGYSPERINPGDKQHRLHTIVKVVAGDTPETLERLATLYEAVVTAGVHRAPSIKVAEAAKVIENTQRDLNIALMNELAVIFHRMGIDTKEVLEAAGTKWNFLRFTPGLVGGHCIGVDPYYLTHAAEKVGLHPQVILAGRRINDSMGKYVADETLKCLAKAKLMAPGARVNVLGLTFKENCPDTRNTKVVDIIDELKVFGLEVNVHDPLADPEEAMSHYGLALTAWDDLPVADAVILAVSHKEYIEAGVAKIAAKAKADGCLIDVKAVLDRGEMAASGRSFWRL